MKTIQILIIENDETIRQRIIDAVGDGDKIDVGNACGSTNISEIKDQLRKTEPDVIVLGIDQKDSPEMRFFNYLRKNFSHLPVLILTPHDRDGANIAITALKRGAVEFIPKTTPLSGSALTVDFFKDRLIPVIKTAPRLNRNVLLTQHFVDSAIKNIEPISPDFFESSLSNMEVLVITGCLGGVAPLYLLLSSLPENLPVPVVVVQHMVEIYSKVLAEDLSRYTKLKVKEVENGDKLNPGWVYISPGDYHVITNRKNRDVYLSLYHGPKVAGFRPSMDILLKSTARQFGKKALVVYLSGGGNDGIEGAKVIDVIGGQIIIQNHQTSLLSDISWKVESHGINDGSYPLERLGQEIARRLV